MKPGKLVYLDVMLLLVIFSCDDSDVNPYVCEAPSLITADQSCNTGKGLILTATAANASLALDWTVIAVKDSAAKGWSGSDPVIEASTSTPSYTVPDSIIQNYKTLVVRAAVKCPAGNSLYSIYYRFVQAKSANGNCVVWVVSN